MASNSDACLFIKKKESLHVIVLLYVNDIIITSNDDRESVCKFGTELSIQFEINNLGELRHFLGLEMENVNDEIMFLKRVMQRRLLKDLTEKKARSAHTPLDANMKIRREEKSLLPDPLPYRALVRSLIYLTITRPNIAFAIARAHTHTHIYIQPPRKPHLEVAKRILKCANSTL